MSRSIYDFDRMRTGAGDGRVYEVYDPRWWRVWRWVSWFWRVYVKREDCATIRIEVVGEEERIVRGVLCPPVRFSGVHPVMTAKKVCAVCMGKGAVHRTRVESPERTQIQRCEMCGGTGQRRENGSDDA